jgi:hypothetical protein
MMLGWHFTSTTLRDGRPIPPIGEWLEHDGDVLPCESGLHASEHPFDALQYAPGNLLHRVELTGDLTPHGKPSVDKHAGRRRKILATIDAEPLLREFAQWCAPQVVHHYLATGDDSLRDAAQAAAWAAAAAAWDAAAAAWDAAWAAARDAQRTKFAEMVDAAFAAVEGVTGK